MYLNVHLKNGILLTMESLWNYHLRKCTLAPWNEFFIQWYNAKKTIIEITSALKKIYPPNYEFKEREMRMEGYAIPCWMYKYNTLW